MFLEGEVDVNENIVDFDSKKKNNCTLFGVAAGKTTVRLIGTYADGTVKTVEVEVEVLGQDFTLSYELNQHDAVIMPGDAPNSYNTGNFPFKLPVLHRDNYVFQGWIIEGFDGVYKEITSEDEIDVKYQEK